MADETKLTAATRLEKLLDNIAGGENEVTPATRLEKFLSYIAAAMEGGGGSGGIQLYRYTRLLGQNVTVAAGATAPLPFSGDVYNAQDEVVDAPFGTFEITTGFALMDDEYNALNVVIAAWNSDDGSATVYNPTDASITVAANSVRYFLCDAESGGSGPLG